MQLFCYQIIWNSSTRAELLKFVDQQRTAQGPDGTYDMNESLGFAYEALSKELYVGQVYLRVYNDQPDFEISEPEALCIALIEFISSLVHDGCPNDADVLSNDNPSSPSPVIADGQEDASNCPVDGQWDDGGSSVAEGHAVEQDENVLIKNLQFSLTSLKVVFLSVFWENVSLCLIFR